MDVQEVASFSLEDFEKAFADMSVADFVKTLHEELGIEIKPGPKKADTIKAGYEAVQALAQGHGPAQADPAVNPPAPPDATPEGAGEARYRARSRTGRARWRDGVKFPPDRFIELAQEQVTPAMSADPFLEFRDPK